MGEEYENKRKRKVIKVKKLYSNHSSGTAGSSRDPDRVSQRSFESTLSRIHSAFSLLWNDTDEEEEIQVIDLDHASHSSNHPIEFLFPAVRQEGVNLNNLLRNASVTDFTKTLIGQKAQFTNLRCPRQRRIAIDFTPIMETNDKEEGMSSDEDHLNYLPKIPDYTSLEHPSDADLSSFSDKGN